MPSTSVAAGTEPSSSVFSSVVGVTSALATGISLVPVMVTVTTWVVPSAAATVKVSTWLALAGSSS